ncbi:MAG: hypothetical protein VYE35_06340, partial [Chloroflexota bacterium]|nr:hypothetical protein [Chloroflexota bacterium]
IDIVSWDEDHRTFITNALSPSEPVHVELLESDQTAIVVVPDRQLSLAIGKEGQNTRLAARLTGWRLDIKGMTEWEEIKESTQALANATASTDDDTAVAAEDVADAVEEAVAIVEEASAAVTIEEDEEPAEIANAPVAETVLEAPAEEVDEDSILEALIKEEEQEPEEVATRPAVAEGLSVEDLGAFTLDDVDLSDEDDEDDEDEEGELPDLGDLPVLIPDAGKIRFAEDIVDEFRGGSRGGRRRRGGGGARGGGARGGGARGGGAAAGGGR